MLVFGYALLQKRDSRYEKIMDAAQFPEGVRRFHDMFRYSARKYGLDLRTYGLFAEPSHLYNFWVEPMGLMFAHAQTPVGLARSVNTKVYELAMNATQRENYAIVYDPDEDDANEDPRANHNEDHRVRVLFYGDTSTAIEDQSDGERSTSPVPAVPRPFPLQAILDATSAKSPSSDCVNDDQQETAPTGPIQLVKPAPHS